MSLIICTECGESVSENAVSCPHCGNPLTAKNNVHQQVSQISCSNTHIIAGLVCIIVGIIGTIGSIFLLPCGIVSMIGGILFISYGFALCTVHNLANCPYCGKEITFSKNLTGVTCTHCKKRSVVENETLKSVN